MRLAVTVLAGSLALAAAGCTTEPEEPERTSKMGGGTIIDHSGYTTRDSCKTTAAAARNNYVPVNESDTIGLYTLDNQLVEETRLEFQPDPDYRIKHFEDRPCEFKFMFDSVPMDQDGFNVVVNNDYPHMRMSFPVKDYEFELGASRIEIG